MYAPINALIYESVYNTLIYALIYAPHEFDPVNKSQFELNIYISTRLIEYTNI